MMNKLRSINAEAAQALAVEGLSFLAAEPERLGLFLSLTGITPQNLRLAARDPGFLSGVLDHLCSDDSLLLAFAGESGVAPEQVATARTLLAGPPPEDP